MPTRKEIEAKKKEIREDPTVAFEVYETVYFAQKYTEQLSTRHQGHDGVGWRWWEARTLNLFWEKIERQKFMMSPGQTRYLQRKAEPYAGQYLRIKEGKADGEN